MPQHEGILYSSDFIRQTQEQNGKKYELAECPHCGGSVKLMGIAGSPLAPTYEVDLKTVTPQSDDVCFVLCEACGAHWFKSIRADSFPAETIEAWNKRR